MRSRAETTRLRIVEAAADLMGTLGYGRTSLEAILRRCRVSRGNFYHHFGSKKELGFAVLDHLGENLSESLRAGMEEVDPLRRIEGMLDALNEGTQSRGCRGGCPLGNLAAELSDVSDEFRARLERIFHEWRDLIAATLSAAARQGGPPVDVQSLARYVICCLEGGILMAKVTRDHREMGNAIHHLKVHVRRQLKRPAA